MKPQNEKKSFFSGLSAKKLFTVSLIAFIFDLVVAIATQGLRPTSKIEAILPGLLMGISGWVSIVFLFAGIIKWLTSLNSRKDKPHQNLELVKPVNDSTAEPILGKATALYCPNCGKQISQEEQTCPKCAENLNNPILSTTQEEKPRKNSKMKPILAAILGVIGVLLFVWFVWPSSYDYSNMQLGILGEQEIRTDRFSSETWICSSGNWQTVSLSNGKISFPEGTTLKIGVKGNCSHTHWSIFLIIGIIGVVFISLIFISLRENSRNKSQKSEPSASSRQIKITRFSLLSLLGILALVVGGFIMLPSLKSYLFANNVSVSIRVVSPESETVDKSTLDKIAQILEKRCKHLGYSGVNFLVTGDRQITGKIPSNINADDLLEKIKKIGLIEFVDYGEESVNVGMSIKTDLTNANLTEGAGNIKHTLMTNTDFESVSVSQNNVGGYFINFSLNETGRKIFYDYTSQNIGKVLAIVLDKVVISAPRITSAVSGNEGIISGSFTKDEAYKIAAILATEPLPLPIEIDKGSKLITPTQNEGITKKENQETPISVNRTPKVGHWEGDQPYVSFDITQDGNIINFVLNAPFVTDPCNIQISEIQVVDNRFTMDMTTASQHEASIGIFTLQGQFDTGSVTGTHRIEFCGRTKSFNPVEKTWQAKWVGTLPPKSVVSQPTVKTVKPTETIEPTSSYSPQGVEGTYLSKFTPLKVVLPFGKYSVGKFEFPSPYSEDSIRKGDPIVFNDTHYTQGIFAHAPSKLVYDIGGNNFTKLSAQLGLVDSINNGNRCGDGVNYVVLIDGKEVFRSRRLFIGSEIVNLEASISGGKELTLIVEDGGADDFNCDWAIWGDPILR